MGEDSIEIAPKATVCTSNCTTQDRVQGKAVVVGFPFLAPDAVRLKPRFFPGFVFPRRLERRLLRRPSSVFHFERL